MKVWGSKCQPHLLSLTPSLYLSATPVFGLPLHPHPSTPYLRTFALTIGPLLGSSFLQSFAQRAASQSQVSAQGSPPQTASPDHLIQCSLSCPVTTCSVTWVLFPSRHISCFLQLSCLLTLSWSILFLHARMSAPQGRDLICLVLCCVPCS